MQTVRTLILFSFAGNLLSGQQYAISTVAGDSALFAPSPKFNGVATDTFGNVYFSDATSHRIWKLSSDGAISPFAGNGTAGFSGDGGLATAAQLNRPSGIAVDSDGNVYICDEANDRIRLVTRDRFITTLAGNGTRGFSGDGGLATNAALYGPMGVAVDTFGNVYIADAANSRIRLVTRDRIISTIAGNGHYGYSGDGGKAKGAQFSFPVGLAIDRSGNVYVADACAIDLCSIRIRKISADGVITTVAGNGTGGFSGDGGPAVNAQLGDNGPLGLTVDGAGNIFIADTYNSRIRKVSPNGIITTVAGNGIAGFGGDGGLATNARLNYPTGVAADARGNLFIADDSNGRIRKVFSFFSYSKQNASPAGGTGSLNFSFPVGFAWTATSTANWITFVGPASGTGSGTVSYQIAANTGIARTTSIAIGEFAFPIEQQAVSSDVTTGSLPHIVASENWKTRVTLINKGNAAAQSAINFFDDLGSPLSLPVEFPQEPNAPILVLASSLNRTLAANASWIVETGVPPPPGTLAGSAALAADGPMDGLVTFQWNGGAQELVLPVETRMANSYLLPFDHTDGAVLGVALNNASNLAATVAVVIRDEKGLQLGSPANSISLAGSGHTAFLLAEQYPATANRRGTIQFIGPPAARIGVLGIRATGTSLAGIPTFTGAATGGGSFAHIASGSGWQTTFVLVNSGTTAALTQLKFLADDGSALSLPVVFPQPGGAEGTVTASVNQTIDAGATMVVRTSAPISNPSLVSGSAQFSSTGDVTGFAILRYNLTGQEAVVPAAGTSVNGYLVAFDNMNATATGIALNNRSAQAVIISVLIRDDSGTQIGSDTLSLAANGHTAFVLASGKYPAAAGIRGTIEFAAPIGTQIGALGVRVNSAGTFTSVPALTK